MSADDIVALYERRARDWAGDRARQTVFIEKDWLDRFIALVQPGGAVLDLGCGPGRPMAAYLVANGLDVCGVDSSPAMIAMARGNLPSREFIFHQRQAGQRRSQLHVRPSRPCVLLAQRCAFDKAQPTGTGT